MKLDKIKEVNYINEVKNNKKCQVKRELNEREGKLNKGLWREGKSMKDMVTYGSFISWQHVQPNMNKVSFIPFDLRVIYVECYVVFKEEKGGKNIGKTMKGGETEEIIL